MSPKFISRPFQLLLLGYILLAGAYTLSIPLWEAPDEPAHFLYVLHVAETGTPPPPPPPQRGRFFEHGFVVSAYEWHQMPLYYGLAAPLLNLNRSLGLLTRFHEFPPIHPEFPNVVRLMVAQPFAWSEVLLVRWFSVALGACTLLTVGWTARRLFPAEPWLPELTAGLVAFVPQFVFLHSYVTNDALAILLSALGLATLVNLAVSDPVADAGTVRRGWLVAGLTGGAALATKMTAWFVVPLAGLLWLILWRRGRRSMRETAGDLLGYLGGLAAIPLLVWLMWPDVIDRLAHSPQASSIRPEFLNLAYLNSLFPTTFASFWGVFGWMNVATPPFFHWLLAGLWGVGLVSAGIWLVASRRRIPTGRMVAIILLLLATLVVFVQFIGFNLTITQPQGRFFYPGVLGPALLAALGWLRLSQKITSVAARRSWVPALVSSLALANLLIWLWILRPAYA